ncbi:MAG TPA: LacI family DNA-binding transcriptional regulator [Woeseiaceae bacterium]|nr:LacI family DNA-binding transcriptional regulator [Woeseiaceae bacterium]
MRAKTTITMDDIARLAKVSKPTVSRALSNNPLVNRDTREHVLSVARKHGYTVNRNAQKLRHKRTNTIAVSLDFLSHRQNHISDPFIFDLLAGVSEALGDCNQDLLLFAPTHNDIEAFQHILASRGADGFIVLGQGHRERMLDEFARSGAPLVVWGAAREDTPYCVVGSDNFRGGRLAAEYFLARGRRRYLFVGDASHSEIFLRRQGLMETLEASGEPLDIADIEISNFAYETAFEAANRYLDGAREVPDAVFTYSDTAAMAFICALANRGVHVPGDVSVVGYNDIPSAGYFNPPLTTVRQDTYQAGKLLVDKLLAMLAGERPSSETINTELVERAT